MKKRIKGISKSQYLKGVQCPKALWFYRHRSDLAPEVSESKQAIFDAGHEIGELAQKYFKNGIEITEEYYEIAKAIKSTEKAVTNGKKVIYEATASSPDGAYSRIDILKKVRGSARWDMIEVKMSTEVKDYYLDDMSLQRHAFEGAGYNIRKSILMHVNNQYVRSGELELKKLFHLDDCTKIVKSRMTEVGGNVAELIAVLNKAKEPDIEIGGHCTDPFDCDYIDHCWQHIPKYSVYNIFKGTKLKSLLSDGIVEVKDVPEEFDCTARQAIDVQALKNNAIYIDKAAIKGFLGRLQYPLYFLDYETINPAIPMYDNSRPYQKIPFQFSLHIQKKKGGECRHSEFLHTGAGDPRPDLIKALISKCGKKGSVVVYNQGFESGVNKSLGEDFPEYKDRLDSITGRMVDLIIPFRSRYLYHPKMKGSYSLKSVLPAFVEDLSYDALEISDGGTASNQYLRCAKGIATDEEMNLIFTNLKKYCYLDTLAEVRLLKILYGYQ